MWVNIPGDSRQADDERGVGTEMQENCSERSTSIEAIDRRINSLKYRGLG
jgi:hypothetical protein